MRCLKSGLVNVVYAVKIRSRVEWGGMRRKPQPGAVAIMKRNRGFVFEEHGQFIAGLDRGDFLEDPIAVPVGCATETAEVALQSYHESRLRLEGFLKKRRFNLLRRLREKLAF
jgi:hypothetical protein